MDYRLAVPLLLFLMAGGFAFAADPPYTVREVFANDIPVGESPDVMLDCVDIDGDAMVGVDAVDVDLNFYKMNGTLLSEESTTCSNASYSAGYSFDDPGLYYVTAELQCAPACCEAVSGCNNMHWFSATKPFAILSIPDGNWAAALAACFSVLFFARKKQAGKNLK